MTNYELGKESAVLIQNAFPKLKKYIDHVYVSENVKIYTNVKIKKERT